MLLEGGNRTKRPTTREGGMVRMERKRQYDGKWDGYAGRGSREMFSIKSRVTKAGKKRVDGSDRY